MRVFLISGFLGSGKTTLAMELAKTLVSQGHKVAAVINEIGEIGIDPDLFQGSGTKIYELFSGCVCCQMGDDLIKTLTAISSIGNVDAVVIEPTGAAFSSQVIDVIHCWSEDIILETIALIDATRFTLMLEELGHLLNDTLFVAKTIVVSKVDQCDPHEVRAVIQQLKDMCPGVPIIVRNLLDEAPVAVREVFSEIG